MFRTFVTAAALAVSALAAPASARTNDYARLDIAQARTLGEKLVICDRARLLSNPPSRNAQRAYVRVDDFRYDLALPPDFTRASGWYDYDLERAYDRLRARGLVDRDDVEAARETYRVSIPALAARPTVGERRFLQQQSSACTRLVREVSRR